MADNTTDVVGDSLRDYLNSKDVQADGSIRGVINYLQQTGEQFVNQFSQDFNNEIARRNSLTKQERLSEAMDHALSFGPGAVRMITALPTKAMIQAELASGSRVKMKNEFGAKVEGADVTQEYKGPKRFAKEFQPEPANLNPSTEAEKFNIAKNTQNARPTEELNGIEKIHQWIDHAIAQGQEVPAELSRLLETFINKE